MLSGKESKKVRKEKESIIRKETVQRIIKKYIKTRCFYMCDFCPQWRNCDLSPFNFYTYQKRYR